VINIKICIKHKIAFGGNIAELFGNYIKCSLSDSHVKVLKVPQRFRDRLRSHFQGVTDGFIKPYIG